MPSKNSKGSFSEVMDFTLLPSKHRLVSSILNREKSQQLIAEKIYRQNEDL